ncbi:MAG: Bug family tripartite tricarboxylate transporter substrate binding protein [Burkholderiales bacterium]
MTTSTPIQTCVTILALMGCAASFAQSYPVKPIRLVAPYPPGGIDVYARALVPKVSEFLGQPVVIDNRAGANGFIGSRHVADSPPDGYTLLFVTASTPVIGIVLTKVAPYDPVKDFTPIINLLDGQSVVVVPAGSPVNSLRELIDLARKYPGKLSFSSSGLGSSFHLNGESIKMATGIDLLHVPYKGSAPALTDVVAGRIDIGLPSYQNAKPQIDQGKLKLLAVIDARRNPALPDITAVGEIIPGFKKAPGWTAIFGPAGMQRPVIEKLNTAFAQAVREPEMQKTIAANGATLRASTADELAALVRDDLVNVAAIVKAAKIPVE